MNFFNKIKSKLISQPETEVFLPKDFNKRFKDIYEKTKAYTMTSPERMYSLYQAIIYIIQNKIEGDIVECGVWKGGSSMISALTLLKLKSCDKKIYLYDTFSGMTKPSGKDRPDTMDKWLDNNGKQFNKWCYASLDEVQGNMSKTNYPKDKIIFVRGDVEHTIPQNIPEKISILRLDTDWYKSTYHELKYLYPRLSSGGVLIIDDYGHHEGAKKAVDEYFAEIGEYPYLSRIDPTCRIILKR